MSQQPAPVYTSGGGNRYHDNPNCHALTGGQNLNDWDCDCWGRCPHSSPRAVVSLAPAEAAAQGKSPCLACFPAGAMRYLPQPNSGQTFGHKAIEVGGEWPHRRQVCARCTVTWPDRNGHHQRYVGWPCASAVVLGLVPSRSGTPLGEP
jgi:hypothetical protein